MIVGKVLGTQLRRRIFPLISSLVNLRHAREDMSSYGTVVVPALVCE